MKKKLVAVICIISICISTSGCNNSEISSTKRAEYLRALTEYDKMNFTVENKEEYGELAKLCLLYDGMTKEEVEANYSEFTNLLSKEIYSEIKNGLYVKEVGGNNDEVVEDIESDVIVSANDLIRQENYGTIAPLYLLGAVCKINQVEDYERFINSEVIRAIIMNKFELDVQELRTSASSEETIEVGEDNSISDNNIISENSIQLEEAEDTNGEKETTNTEEIIQDDSLLAKYIERYNIEINKDVTVEEVVEEEIPMYSNTEVTDESEFEEEAETVEETGIVTEELEPMYNDTEQELDENEITYNIESIEVGYNRVITKVNIYGKYISVTYMVVFKLDDNKIVTEFKIYQFNI